MTAGVETEVFESIEQIACEIWDSVAGNSVGISHALLLCRERNSSDRSRTRYFLARELNRSMAVSVAVIPSADHEEPLTPLIFGRQARIFGSLFKSIDRALVCGRIPGPGAPVLVRRDVNEQPWVRIICSAMEDYARLHGLTTAYTGVLPEQLALSAELSRRRYLIGVDRPIATLDVSWSDTSSYLDALRLRRGKKCVSTAKYEIRRFEKSGTSISRFRDSDFSRLFDLLQRHNVRKNNRDLEFQPGFLEDLSVRLEDNCIVYVARRNDALIGVVVFVVRNNTARAWLVGIDHDADEDTFSYFNLCFYHPCDQFTALGIQRIFFGNAAQYAKYRRGCDILETQFFVRATSALLNLVMRPIFALQNSFFRRKYRSALPQKSKES